MAAQGFLLIALQLALTASKTASNVRRHVGDHVVEQQRLALPSGSRAHVKVLRSVWKGRRDLGRQGLVARHVGIQSIHRSERGGALLCTLEWWRATKRSLQDTCRWMRGLAWFAPPA